MTFFIMYYLFLADVRQSHPLGHRQSRTEPGLSLKEDIIWLAVHIEYAYIPEQMILVTSSGPDTTHGFLAIMSQHSPRD